MRSGEARRLEETGLELTRDETVEALRSRFEWKRGFLSRLLVRILSLVMDPLATGTYRGRALDGEPQRPYPASNSPLTVFFIPDVRRIRLFLAARLRTRDPINVIQDPAAEVKPTTYGVQGRKFGSLRLETLVNIQRASTESVIIVPVTRAFHQHLPEAPPTMVLTRLYMLTPMPHIRRAGSFMRELRTARLKNCEPIDLARWLDSNPQEGPFSQSTALHDEIIDRIESEHRASVGPPIPQPWEMRKSVLGDPILHEFMVDYASEEDVHLKKVAGEARGYVREIASKIRVGAFRCAGIILNVGFDRLLTGFEVERDGIRRISECDTRSRVMLVCSHKSYMDPLILAYGILRSGLTAPQQAAGINLNIWPLGWFLRRCGGFFMRRSFIDQPVYREAFNAYVRRLLSDNYIVAFYVEGTRSRDGKMLRPKTGFMKILDEAVQFGACDGITVFPVYLGYDRVPEEGAHVKEMAGGYKIAETWGLFKRLYKSVTTTLGRAYIRFGTEVDFRNIVSEYGLDAATCLICEKIDEVTVVTARSLASAALLSSGKELVTDGEFGENSAGLLALCRDMGLPLAPDADGEGIRAAVNWLAGENRVVIERDEEGGESFRVDGDRRRFLEYNKNILLAHLLAPAFIDLAEHCGGPLEESLDFLVQLFSGEFVFGPGFAGKIRLGPGGGGSTAFLLDSFLEGYLVTCGTVGSLDPSERVDVDDMVLRCFAMGRNMISEGAIRRPESLSRIVFENALKRLAGMEILTVSTEPAKGDRVARIIGRGNRFDTLGELRGRIGSFYTAT